MKPRHAAALALMGWYLIAPPIRNIESNDDYLDEHAAYPDWRLICVLNTEAQCEHLRDFARESVAGYPQLLDSNPEMQQYSEAECVASDDPRIRGIDLHPQIPPPPKSGGEKSR
jgi:hypothetical protein